MAFAYVSRLTFSMTILKRIHDGTSFCLTPLFKVKGVKNDTAASLVSLIDSVRVPNFLKAVP